MEFLLFLLLLGTAIWAVGFMRLSGVWGCVIAVLIAGTVFGHAFYHLAVLTADRILLIATCGLYVHHRRMGRLAPKQWSKGDVAFLLFLSILLASTFTHDWRAEGMKPLARLLFFVLLPSTIYWMARDCQLAPRQLRWLFCTFGIFGLYLSITAVAEKYELSWAVFPKYIADPGIAEFLGRARGPVLNPSGNGVLITLGLCSWIMLIPYQGALGKRVLMACLSLFFFGLYCTLTRCVWMGGALGFGLVLWFTMPVRLRVPSILLASMLVTSVVGLNWDRLVAFKRDKNVSTADMAQSASLRPILAVVAWKMFQDYPIYGCGYGQYLDVAPDYLQDRDYDLPLTKGRPYVQHNIFLSVLTETGLVGFLVYTYLLVYWSALAWRLWNRRDGPLETRQMGLLFLGTMAAIVSNGMFQDLTIMPMMNAYLFFLAGTVQGLTAAPRAVPRTLQPPQELCRSPIWGSASR